MPAFADTSQPESKQRDLKNRRQNAARMDTRLPRLRPDFIHNRSCASPGMRARQREISFKSNSHSIKTGCLGHPENRSQNRTMEAVNYRATAPDPRAGNRPHRTLEIGQIRPPGVACLLQIQRWQPACLLQTQNLHQTQRLQKSHVCCKLENGSDSIGLPPRTPSPTPTSTPLPARSSPRFSPPSRTPSTAVRQTPRTAPDEHEKALMQGAASGGGGRGTQTGRGGRPAGCRPPPGARDRRGGKGLTHPGHGWDWRRA